MRDLTLETPLGRLACHDYPVPGAPGAPPVVLAHGIGSEKTSNQRFPRIATALNVRGWRAFAFDFRGCGESEAAVLTLPGLVADLAAVIEHVAPGQRPYAIWGHSLGALVGLHAATPAATTLVLTGALTGPVGEHWRARYSPAQLAELEASGRLVLPGKRAGQQTAYVDRSLLAEFAGMDQQALLGRLAVPLLAVHGTVGEEQGLALVTRMGWRHFPAGSRLELVEGADHGFNSGLERLIELGVGWLEARLPPGVAPARQ